AVGFASCPSRPLCHLDAAVGRTVPSPAETHGPAAERLLRPGRRVGPSRSDLTHELLVSAPQPDVTIDTGSGTARSIRRVAVDMSVDDLHTLLGQSRLGVLATIKTDGRPQLSPVMPYYDRAAGVIY